MYGLNELTQRIRAFELHWQRERIENALDATAHLPATDPERKAVFRAVAEHLDARRAADHE